MPKPAAIAIVFSKDQEKVLLVKRRDVPIWVLPGGGIDMGESPEQAAVREAAEETGVEVEVTRKSCEYFPTNRLGGQTHVFICRAVAGSPQPSSETTEVNFFAPDAVPGLLFPVHQRWIEDARRPAATPVPYQPIEGIRYHQAIWFALRHPWLAFCYLGSLRFWKGFFGHSPKKV